MHRAIRTSVWLPCILLFSYSAAQDVPEPLCDETAISLSKSLPDDVRYRARGSRCEGLYAPKYAATGEDHDLPIVSVFTHLEEQLGEDANELQMRWVAPDPSPADRVRVLARSTQRDIHYRMDARAAVDEAFGWPTEVLREVGIRPDGLGILVSYETAFGDKGVWAHLPVAVSSGSSATPDTDSESLEVFVDVRPIRSLRDAHVTVTRTDEQGQLVYYVDRSPLAPDPTSNTTIVRYRLKLSPPWGIHRIQISARSLDGQPVTSTFYCAAHKAKTRAPSDE